MQTQPYSYKFDGAQEGQLYDNSFFKIDSFAAEEEIPFGKALKRGTNKDKQCLLWKENNKLTPFLGVAVFSHTEQLNTTINTYKQGKSVNVLTEGRVWVKLPAGVNVEAGTQAYLVTAADEAAGYFTDVEGDNLLVGKFITSGEAETLVVVEISPVLTYTPA